jgi:hypothetical protein
VRYFDKSGANVSVRHEEAKQNAVSDLAFGNAHKHDLVDANQVESIYP